MSDPVDRYIGQVFFKIFIHQLFVPGFRKILAAGPAAEQNPGSGPPDIKVSAAGRAFFFDLHGESHTIIEMIFQIAFYINRRFKKNDP
jgi:hypothetical protein